MNQQGGLVGKASVAEPDYLEGIPRTHRKVEGEPTPQNCPQTFTYLQWHACTQKHTSHAQACTLTCAHACVHTEKTTIRNTIFKASIGEAVIWQESKYWQSERKYL